MAEQDRLLAGYQKENEKLVSQLRDASRRADEVRDSMYNANLALGRHVNNNGGGGDWLGDRLLATPDGKKAKAQGEGGGGRCGRQSSSRRSREDAAGELRRALAAEQARLGLEEEVRTLQEDNVAKHEQLRMLQRRLDEIEGNGGGVSTQQMQKQEEVQSAVESLRRELAQARFEHLTEAKALKR